MPRPRRATPDDTQPRTEETQMIETSTAAALAFAVEHAAEQLATAAREAAAVGDHGREDLKRAYQRTALRYARHLDTSTGPVDVRAAQLIAHAAQMGGILMASTTIADDLAAMERLAEQGWLILVERIIGGHRQQPYYAMACPTCVGGCDCAAGAPVDCGHHGCWSAPDATRVKECAFAEMLRTAPAEDDFTAVAGPTLATAHRQWLDLGLPARTWPNQP